VIKFIYFGPVSLTSVIGDRRNTTQFVGAITVAVD